MLIISGAHCLASVPVLLLLLPPYNPTYKKKTLNYLFKRMDGWMSAKMIEKHQTCPHQSMSNVAGLVCLPQH